MKCEQVTDLVVDRLMDALDKEQHDRLEAHLATCSSCAADAAALERIWADLVRIPDFDATRPTAPPRSTPAPAVHASEDQSSGSRTDASERARTVSPWLQAAAAVALLLAGGAGGFLARGPVGGPGPSPGSAYLFLVRGEQPDETVPEETLVREYGAWAGELAGQGKLLGGDKLADEAGRWVSGTGEDTRTRSDVSGYFLIAASDYAEAIEIANGSPHVRYGGTFEIRQIDPVLR